MKDWTDEITLRAPEPEDLDMMLAFENDAELWAEGTATGPYSRFQLKTYLSEAQNDVFVDRQLRFMIVHHDRGTLGMVDLCTFDPRHNRAEVGIMVCKEMRGQGVGRKALLLLEAHCFDLLGIHQLYAYVRKDNVGCMRLFLSAGYDECGCLHDWVRVRGRYHTVCMLQKLNPSRDAQI
ncbi:MAG TPA: GNAT family N-acetyltransferase [Candidatus Phocaeicola gallinarum]|nr:GNAT family N-acetyltransferase [Candidatus Phocaeicola gallinarum]